MSQAPAPSTASARSLPVADMASVRAHTRGLARRHRRGIALVIGLHAVAAAAALVAPRVIGLLVDEISHGRSLAVVDRLALWIAAAVVVQTVTTWFARRASFVLGETIFAELREQFMERVVELPLSTVERAGTGDLVSRTTNDVEALSRVIRFGVPAIFVGSVTTVITVVAAFVTGWQVALAVLVGVPILGLSTRRYLRHAPDGYLRERATYAVLNGVVTESADGGRTIDALGLRSRRRRRMDDALRDCYDAELYTLGLRLRWFPSVEFAFFAPVAVTLLWGGFLISQDLATAGTVTAVALYVQQMAGPLDELISWLDEIQIGATSLARVIGIGDVPPDRAATGEEPADDRLAATDVHYSYRAGRDVLRGVSLDLRPGERLAIVGPSGAGKSTLGRLMAGIDGPRQGRVEVGGVRLVDLELARLRGQVALVTQEHHVFVGSLEDNLRLARPDASREQLLEALAAVDARDWAERLPGGLATRVGSGGHRLSEPQAQQLALARLVLADPHTLVLDEATSLLDPRAARHLERSLAAVVEGRTVVAIAHRLMTAHDANRVCVVEDGEISEIGSHEELLRANGAYAALWRSWRDEPSVV
ncbi:ABC transporter ATP-binding protein [Terrabacter sp. BE26]|uniref:ABC transporter ATP-binding protein n=1 Tax=Terrabacter sp. BE26 TaxID=2898152 RepID=UPI0035BE85AA